GGRKEGGRRRRRGRVRSAGAGPRRAVPDARRAVRAAGPEGGGGRPDQGGRRGQGQRGTVAAVGRGGPPGADAQALVFGIWGRRRRPAVRIVEGVQQRHRLLLGGDPAPLLLGGQLHDGARPD